MDQIDALRTGLEKVAVPSILSELDSGAIAGINAAAAQLLGAPVAQLLGTNVGSFVRRHERCARSAPGEALLTGAVEVHLIDLEIPVTVRLKGYLAVVRRKGGLVVDPGPASEIDGPCSICVRDENVRPANESDLSVNAAARR
mgnify:CR=1 FL=1